jgi:hypothetical protein
MMEAVNSEAAGLGLGKRTTVWESQDPPAQSLVQTAAMDPQISSFCPTQALSVLFS